MSKAKAAESSIKQLLEAEQKASAKIQEARSLRNKNMKKAQEDIEKEIALLKAKREEKFLKYKEQYAGEAKDLEEKLNAKKDVAKKEIEKHVSANREDVIKLLVAAVKKVQY